jgi:hypothetical protein
MAKEITELVDMNVIDPVPVLRGVVDVEDDEAGPGRVELVGGIEGVGGVGMVEVGKVEAPEVVVEVSLVFAMVALFFTVAALVALVVFTVIIGFIALLISRVVAVEVKRTYRRNIIRLKTSMVRERLKNLPTWVAEAESTQ